MCHFVTMTVSDSIDPDELREQLKRHRREFIELDAAGLRPIVRDDEHYFVAGNPAGCNCGTALGSFGNRSTSEQTRNRHEAAKVRAMRRKGWGEAKIARALERSDAMDRHKQELFEAEGGGWAEIENWSALIAGLQEVAKPGPVGILLHMYDGALTDAFEVRRDEVAPADLKDFLGSMEEDVLYQLSARNSREAGVRRATR